jgi:hypothetical protein
LYGAETWDTSERKKKQKKYLESFEILSWRRMEISWTDHMRNEALHTVKEESKCSIYNTKRGRLTGLVTSGVEIAF